MPSHIEVTRGASGDPQVHVRRQAAPLAPPLRSPQHRQPQTLLQEMEALKKRRVEKARAPKDHAELWELEQAFMKPSVRSQVPSQVPSQPDVCLQHPFRQRPSRPSAPRSATAR